MKSKLGHCFLLLVLLFSLIACAAKTTTPPLPTSVSVSPLDAPSDADTTMISPLAQPDEPVVVPTSIPGKGTVKGKLDKTVEIKEPFGQGDLRLAPMLPSTTVEKPVFSLSLSQDPLAILQPDDTFYFVDVPPGQYVVVYWTPAGSFLFSDPDTGYTLIVEVEANKTVDLEDLVLTPE